MSGPGLHRGADDDEARHAPAKARVEQVMRALVEQCHLTAYRVTCRMFGRSRPAPRAAEKPGEDHGERVDIVVAVKR